MSTTGDKILDTALSKVGFLTILIGFNDTFISNLQSKMQLLGLWEQDFSKMKNKRKQKKTFLGICGGLATNRIDWTPQLLTVLSAYAEKAF